MHLKLKSWLWISLTAVAVLSIGALLLLLPARFKTGTAISPEITLASRQLGFPLDRAVRVELLAYFLDGGTATFQIVTTDQESLVFSLDRGQDQPPSIVLGAHPRLAPGATKLPIGGPVERGLIRTVRRCKDTVLTDEALGGSAKLHFDSWLRDRLSNEKALSNGRELLLLYPTAETREVASRAADAMYYDLIISGCRVIEPAQQLQQLFDHVEHSMLIQRDMMVHPPELRGKWTTSAFFRDRYELTMSCDVEMMPDGNRVATVGSVPELRLFEIDDITTAGGNAFYNRRWLAALNLAEWARVVESNGDFAVVGVELKDPPVPKFAAYVAQTRVFRKPIRVTTDD